MIKETINLLGLRARDKVTGLEGVIDVVSFDLYGCVQVSIRPPVKDGELKDARWFDVQRCHIISGDRVMAVPDFKAVATKPETYTHGAADKPVARA